MTRRARTNWLLPLALVATASVSSAAFAADACVDAAATARVAMDSASYRSAKLSAQICAAETCAPELREECADILQRADGSLARLTVAVVDTHGQPITNTLVQVANQSLAPEEPVLLDPGEYTVVIETPDGTRVKRHVVLSPGEAKRESVIVSAGVSIDAPAARATGAAGVASGAIRTNVPVGTADASKPTFVVNQSKLSLYRTVGLTAAVVGFVGLGIGGYYGLLDVARRDEAGCTNGHCASQANLATFESAKSAGTVSAVFLVGGAVLAGGGLATWLSAPSLAAVSPLDASARKIRFAPSVGTNGGGMSVQGAF